MVDVMIDRRCSFMHNSFAIVEADRNASCPRAERARGSNRDAMPTMVGMRHAHSPRHPGESRDLESDRFIDSASCDRNAHPERNRNDERRDDERRNLGSDGEATCCHLWMEKAPRWSGP